MEEIDIVIGVIGAWFWHLFAYISLVTGIIILLLPRTNVTASVSISFILIFIITEFIAWSRKKTVHENT